MSSREPSPQEKWQKRNGYIAKTFKLRREVAEQFAAACTEEGVSQASQITKMMLDFCGNRNRK